MKTQPADITPDQKMRNDVDFIMSALNNFWHEANEKLRSRASLGDIEKKNYEFQLHRSAELMHDENSLSLYIKAAAACKLVNTTDPFTVAQSIDEMVTMLKDFRALLQQMIHILPTGKNRNEVCDTSIKLCALLDKIEK